MFTPERAVLTKGKSKSKPSVEFAEFNGNLSGQEVMHWAKGYVKGGSRGHVGVIPQTNAPDVYVNPMQVIVKNVDGDITIYDGPRFQELYTVIETPTEEIPTP